MPLGLPKAFRRIGLIITVVATSCLLFSAEQVPKLNTAPKLVKNDLGLELKRRGIIKNYIEYQQYISSRVAKTSESDKCRLQWIETLVRRPVDAPQEAEEFTRQIFSLSRGDRPLLHLLEEMSVKLSSQQKSGSESAEEKKDTPGDDPFQFLTLKIHQSRQSIDRAFRSLSSPEKIELREKSFAQTTADGALGYRFGGDDYGERVVQLMLRIDLNEILNAGRHLAPLTQPEFIRSLEEFYQQSSDRPGLRELQTEDGIVLIGGVGPNVYNLDESSRVYAVVDFGGDDIYNEGSVTGDRPVVVILDLNGNDVYRGQNRGIQGAAVMGASLLLDRSGNDIYQSMNLVARFVYFGNWHFDG